MLLWLMSFQFVTYSFPVSTVFENLPPVCELYNLEQKLNVALTSMRDASQISAVFQFVIFTYKSLLKSAGFYCYFGENVIFN